MCRNLRFLTLALASLAAVPVAWCAPDEPDRDDRREVGRLAFRDNCLMCHSAELSSRSRLTAKQWGTEIDKMIGWGAPVPAELKAPLLDYLVGEFSDPQARPVPPAERITLRAALARVAPLDRAPNSGDRARGATLYAAQCGTCHGPDARGADLGTCLVEKPVLLRPADFAEVVRAGRHRMPGFAAALKPEQEADILAWLRTLRFEMATP